MPVYVLIEKVQGDPDVHLISTDRKEVEDRFVQLMRETEHPDVEESTAEKTIRKALAENEFDYGDDCCIYVRECSYDVRLVLTNVLS